MKKMSDAFVYMFVIGSGTSSGVAVVAFVSYKVFRFMQRREASAGALKRKKRGIV